MAILQSRIGGLAVPFKAAPIPSEKSHASAIFALTGVLLTLLTSTMFQAISIVVIPRAVADLNGFSRYPWPSTTFALTSAIAMLVFAKLSDLYGRKWIYLANTGIFVGSLFVGAAAGTLPIPIDGMNQFIAAHGLLGISSGAIISLSYILIGDLFPPAQRARYLALVVVAWAFAFVVGPGIGGWITDHFSWRWAFVATAPIGIIATATVYFKLPKMRPPLIRRKIDWAGIATLCGWVLPLLLALTLIGQAGRSEWNVNALMITSATFAVVFLFVERTEGNVGRNSIYGPGLVNIDFSILKRTKINEMLESEFRAEFFNLLNRANFGQPNANMFAAPTAGQITTLATPPRQIQFALKLIF